MTTEACLTGNANGLSVVLNHAMLIDAEVRPRKDAMALESRGRPPLTESAVGWEEQHGTYECQPG